jgi:hypothetical protein
LHPTDSPSKGTYSDPMPNGNYRSALTEPVFYGAFSQCKWSAIAG